MARQGVQLAARPSNPPEPCEGHWEILAGGCRIEQVNIRPEAQFDYRWSGNAHYLALHKLSLRDGEAFCGDRGRSTRRDLGGALTFVPAGESVSGWSYLNKNPQSFVALYIDPDSISNELENNLSKIELSPKLYFENEHLKHTLSKISTAFSSSATLDTLYIDHLACVGILELCHSFTKKEQVFSGSGLSRIQEIQLVEFIEAHLHSEIKLDDLAAITGLSRFHFLRLFKVSIGKTPYQFVLHRRIERAKEYLQLGWSVEVTYAAVGFKSKVLFARAFQRTAGVSPHVFLRTRN